MARITAALGIMAVIVTPAWADPPIDKDTKCTAVVGYLDRKDSPHAQEAYGVARQLLIDLDSAAKTKGQTSLLDPLSKEKAEDDFILVLESCRDSPQQTLGQTASDTYDGLRDLQVSPGPR